MGKSAVLDQKKALVEEIKEKVEKSQGMVLVDYRGLNVDEINELRANYRKAGVDYKVYKNTMMRFAFKEAGLEDFNEYLTGPNAVAFGFEDPVQAAKVSHDFAKDNEKLEIKAGIIDGKLIGLEEIKELADLPPREVLVAKALGGLNAPISGFANVLQGTVRNLVYVLEAVRAKEAEEA